MNIYEKEVSIIFGIVDSEQNGITVEKLINRINENYRYTIFPTKFEDFVDMNINTGRFEHKNNRIYITEEGKKTLAFVNKN
jgi:predicted transcriptional regulator